MIESPVRQSLLELFLEALDKSPRLCYERTVFRRVFGLTTLEDVQAGHFATVIDPGAWIHDEDENNYPRYYNGLMSISSLHEITKLKVRGVPLLS